MAVPTAESDERAVEAIVPGAVFIHVPQAVLISTDLRSAEDDGKQRQSQCDKGHVACRRAHPHSAKHNPRKNDLKRGLLICVNKPQCSD